MGYEAIIFDLDGTLVHTDIGYINKTLNKALAHFKKSASIDIVNKFWFETDRNNLIKDNFGIDVGEFWEKYEKSEDLALRKKSIKVYEDIDFLDKLHDSGYKTGIVTGAPQHIADMEIEEFGRDKLDAIVIAHHFSNITPKPDPEGINECMNLLSVSPDKSMYIGNGHEDVLSARNANVLDVLIDRGEYKFEEDIGPSLKIYSLYELENMLDMGKKK